MYACLGASLTQSRKQVCACSSAAVSFVRIAAKNSNSLFAHSADQAQPKPKASHSSCRKYTITAWQTKQHILVNTHHLFRLRDMHDIHKQHEKNVCLLISLLHIKHLSMLDGNGPAVRLWHSARTQASVVFIVHCINQLQQLVLRQIHIHSLWNPNTHSRLVSATQFSHSSKGATDNESHYGEQ